MLSDVKTAKSAQLQEIVRCGRDPIHFIKKHVFIQHPTRGKVQLDTYAFQDDCVQAFEANRFNIVLKSRQLGLSTICAAYALWLAIFFKNKNILVIATKLPTAQNFTKKVKYALKHLPKWLVLPTFQFNQREIRFSNGSTITAIPTSEDAGRSEALSLLIVDEAAFIKNFEDIWTGLYSTISRGGRAIVLSTPNGADGQYYKLWKQAEAKQNDFHTICLPWTVHPDQDQAWYDRETRGMSRRAIAQELCCDFLSSGDTFLQADTLDELRRGVVSGQRDNAINELVRWHRPEPGTKYVIGADVSRGDGNDYSAFHVVQAPSMLVMAEYKGKCRPDRFAELLAKVGREYGNALIAIENNNIGYMACAKLQDMAYPRLYYEDCGGSYDYRPLRATEVPGFTTSAKTRDKMLAKLEETLRNSTLRPTSERLYKEFTTFIWHGNRAESTRDSNDDLVMSLAIATYVIDAIFGQQTSRGASMASALVKAMSLSRSTTQAASVPRTMAPSQRRDNFMQQGQLFDEHAWLLR